MITPKNVPDILGKRILLDGYDLVLDLEKSKGVWLYDSAHSKNILDFFGFFATSPLGMNHPKMFEPEFLKELNRAALNKIVNSDIYTVEMAEFVDALSKTAPDYMKYFFFVEGGALAVENALKTSFDWKVRKNFEKGYKKEVGQKIMHLKEAFHGRTGYTMSLTNTFDPKKTQYFPKFSWPRVTNPKIKFPLNEKNLREVIELEKKSLDEMQHEIDANKDDIAAFIMEPIQGEGGDNHFRKEYFEAVRKITSDNDILFIVDEVQSGLGITGKWWAHEHFNVKPDIIAFGKKTQVCGIMVGPKVDEVKDNVFHVSSRINSTWGGNIVDMVRARRYIEIMIEDNILKNVEKVGAYFIKSLQDLQDKYPQYLSNTRGRGLMVSVDLKDSKTRDSYSKILFKNNLLTLISGEKGIRFRPPLILEPDHVNKAIEILEKSLKEL
ncbi:MAG: L-lysine 6-transaminase [Thermoplasmata archaeon]